ncbi:MAG TPA: universal stress protein [Fimbriimonas sp.]|nr:universal stress protein [Fimbriimonas sp.]
MKALIAVDPCATFKPALNLLKRLDFQEAQYAFASVSTPYVEYAFGMMPSASMVVPAAHSQREAAEHAVASAVDQSGIAAAERIVEEGAVPSSLMRIAREHGCDLIAAASTLRRTANPWQIGSVTRKLALASEQSVLITKDTAEREGSVKAVFATDHSEYAKACLEMLLDWRPRGIGEIVVVTAFNLDKATEDVLKDDTQIALDFQKWVDEEAKCLAEGAAAALHAIAPKVSTFVEEGEPNDVIEAAMMSSKSELLILGAQGHGLLERLLIGSTSMHQALVEPYPVLLLRVPHD